MCIYNEYLLIAARSKATAPPKNKTEQKKFEREIKKTGTIKTDYQLAETDQVSGVSPVTEEEITLPTSKKTTKKKAHVRTRRTQRRAR